LLQIVEKPKPVEGEIVTIDSDTNVSEHAIIVSAGEGTAKTPMLYKVGQRIAFPKFMGLNEILPDNTP